jgi:hypothetical protein
VAYEEIMGWFCQGFGFGEIDLAYELSRESGLPVASVFEMRRSGLGWGVIKQQLAPRPAKSRGKPGTGATPEPADIPEATVAPGNPGENPGNSNGHKGPYPIKTPKPRRR